MQDGTSFGNFGGGYGGGYGEAEQPQPAAQPSPAPHPQPVVPDVVYAPAQPRTRDPGYLPFIPNLPTVAAKVDNIAKRIPWWVWVTGTLLGVWYLNRRKRKGGSTIRLGD